MSDNQLVRSCLQGDVDAYRKIIERYRGKAMAMAINISGNFQDAEDVCQEAFIRAYNNLNKFDHTKNFKDWFYTIVYNQSIDVLRKRRRLAKFFQMKKGDLLQSRRNNEPTPEEIRPLSEKLLKKLSPKERTTVFLWASESYSSEEIASVIKCSASTARVHLYKARKKIKRLIEEKNA